MIYLFGFAFFLAGNLVGYNVDKVGLIFLFSHGVTGTCLMIASQIGKLFSSPIIGDLPRRQSAYLTINISMFVIALIMVVLCNLSKTLRKKRHMVLIPMLIYAGAFLMTILFSKIFGYTDLQIV